MACNTDRYRSGRDQVFALGDYHNAAQPFSWPQLIGAFNWATDWFDVIARGNDRTALRIVEEDGSEQQAQLRRDGRPLRPGRDLARNGSASARATGSS